MSEVELSREELRRVATGPRGIKPKLETYKEVLDYNLNEIIKQKEDVSYVQDIMLPVPEESIKKGDPGSEEIVILAGKIKRHKPLDTEVTMETETIKGRDGKDITMINLILKIESKEQAQKILDFIQER